LDIFVNAQRNTFNQVRKQVSGSCMQLHNCWRMYRQSCWSPGTDQSGWIPCASKNSSKKALKDRSCSGENGGSFWRLDGAQEKIFFRRVLLQSSKECRALWYGILPHLVSKMGVINLFDWQIVLKVIQIKFQLPIWK
jgi:hypothetical protein